MAPGYGVKNTLFHLMVDTSPVLCEYTTITNANRLAAVA